MWMLTATPGQISFVLLILDLDNGNTVLLVVNIA